MRTFGTEIDLVIDNELRKGMNQYNMILYQNGNKLDIYIKKMTIHFLTAAVPYGNVTKYYFELETDYMDFLEQDEVKVEIEKNGVSVEVSTFYIKSFKKGEAISTYVAYTSLVEPEKIRLYKIDEERPWRVDWNTGAKTIREILDTFLTPIGMSMSEYPTYTGTFVSYYADWENMSLAQLISACGILEGCNYVLIGNVFHPIRPSTSSSFKSYKISETVYKDNFYQQRSDAKCGIMDIGYKRWAYEDSTSEDPMLGFQVSFTSMLCHWERTSRGTGKFSTDFPLIPAEHSKKLFDHFADKLSCYFGFDMNVYSVSYLGDALLEPGDRVCFYSNDKSAFFYPSELIWEWDGGLKCTAKSEAVQKSGTSDATVSLQELANTLYTLSTTLQNVRYNSVTTKTLEADSATIGLLKVEQADVKYATIQSLTATEAKITTLDSTTIKTDELYAKVAELDYIKSDHADIANLKSTMITADNLRTEIAKIGYLTADEADIRYLTVSTANATFLHADMSDMDIAKIQTLFATAGIVSDMTIKDGHITGVLDSVTVNANSITTGTLSVDRLVIRGSEKSLVYELNNISGALQAKSVDTLNGEILTQRTITADKLVAKSITSNEIKAGTITSDEIAAGTIKAANINVTDLVGNSAFINSLKSNTVIVGLQNDINGISVGGRNLVRGTETETSTTYNGGQWHVYSLGNTKLEPDEEYVLSFDAKSSNGKDKMYWSFAKDGTSQEYITACLIIDSIIYKRYVIKGKIKCTSDKYNQILYASNNGWASVYGNTGTIYVKNVKLEKGNKPTDWTPAPEDVDSSISTIKSLADAAQSTANSANALATLVNNNTEKQYEFAVDLSDSKYDQDTYYPVVINNSVPDTIVHSTYIVGTTLNGIKPSWSTHSSGSNSTLQVRLKAAGWGTSDGDNNGWIERNSYNWCSKPPAYVARQCLYNSRAIFLLRGGGYYYVRSPKINDTATVYTTRTNIQSDDYPWYVEPTKSPTNAYPIANPFIIGKWCYDNDITYINGGKIYTGTVTADKIAANSITADKLSVDAITSRNYVKDVAGTKISLADGSYDSKYTKIDAEGKISCSNISITGADSKLEIVRTVDKWTNTVKLDSFGLKLQYGYGDDTSTDVWITNDGLYAQGTELIGWSAQQVPFIANVADVRTSSGASLNTVNSNLAQLSDDKVLKSNRGWYPNGKNMNAVPPGVYSTNPGAVPNSLGGLNTYGTLLILRENSYQTAIYMSVTGQLAIWASNVNAWSVIKS